MLKFAFLGVYGYTPYQWYKPFLDLPDPNHLLYPISPAKDQQGNNICSILPLANLRQSIHLLPKFGRVAPKEWTSSTVLD